MKKIIQEKIVKIIQPEIVKYYCDKPSCGHELNFYHRKSMWWRRKDGKPIQLHFCKQEGCEDALNDVT